MGKPHLASPTASSLLRTVLDPKVAYKVIDRLSSRQRYREGEMAEELTEREVEVLQRVAREMNNKAIGGTLFISPNTVQVHLRNIFGKLGVHSRAEAVAFAMDEGWISLDSDD